MGLFINMLDVRVAVHAESVEDKVRRVHVLSAVLWRHEHASFALGLAACSRGHRVRFTTNTTLVSDLIEALNGKMLLHILQVLALMAQL
jgi:plasmid stability protein